MKYPLFIISFFLLSCSVKPQNKADNGRSKPDKSQLNNTWILIKIEGQKIDLKLLNSQPMIEFDVSKMTIKGNDGCNEFGGKINKLDKLALVFGPIMSTEMACPNMDVPFAMGRLLGEVGEYQVKDGNLYLLNEEHVLLEFSKKEPEIFNKEELHNKWILKKIEGKKIDLKLFDGQPMINIDITKMRVNGYDGCNSVGGGISKLEKSELIFSSLMTTLMACPNLDNSLTVTRLLGEVAEYRLKDGNLILLNTEHIILLEFGIEEPKTPNKTRLHDIWALKKIKGKPYDRKLVNQQPILEFHVANMSIIGNDGCNDFGGKIKTLDGSHLVFGSLLGTQMACPNMDVSFAINQALVDIVGYNLKGLDLFLLGVNDEILLQYGKVD